MYTPAHFDWSDASQIRQLIAEQPLGLGAEAGFGGGRLDAASVPVIRPFDLLL